jgi:hypothetical protein
MKANPSIHPSIGILHTRIEEQVEKSPIPLPEILQFGPYLITDNPATAAMEG